MAFWSRRSKLVFNLTTRSIITTHKPRVSFIRHENQSNKFASSHFGCIGSDYRCYHVDRRPNILSVIKSVGFGIELTIFHGKVETMPYTKRKHFLLIPPFVERDFGVHEFEQMKAGFEGKVLPEMHPYCVRVTMILKHVLQAVQRESKKDEGVKLGISHMVELEWEVLVVKDDVVNAHCLPNGKVFVFTGLLELFTTDEEIATIIGHEVAHIMARHAAEGYSKNFWPSLGRQILYMFGWLDLDSTSNSVKLDLPFIYRVETEADYIGLMLMASAGYHPRAVLKVFEKVGQTESKNIVTYPSYKTRSKLLSEASVVQEAISKYEEAISGRDVDT